MCASVTCTHDTGLPSDLVPRVARCDDGAFGRTRASLMESLNNAAGDVLRRLMASQPTTPAKVAFAWRMAAGSALGRAGDPSWRKDGVLVVRASSDAWRREIRRATPMLLARVRELVGGDVVRKIVIE